ncbi:MAG: GntR family transcriptional regulator [Acidobacteria bacterium]|nr:GntR family transcriptional regulator [Acidobacteriota bacterium]NIM60888.1 GntR family transcriptional regulator [Acidobacteriota bacterium]NIO60422.1 GntR family transcriptional regulator [Acidobacteriota bacterium]NIQ31517.1 GntR family transcriptional regulator [Acidobacteriota bacterium]NIQ86753.1 GntR family transcriptional regulator [Acidobacteriota bacterium]
MIEIDPASPVPLYLQIADEMRRLIAMGALKPGDKAPTVREIAVTTRVNRNTAARAIQHLEAEGVVRTRVGQGTFVESSASIDRAESDRAIDDSIDRLLVHARTLGVPLAELDRRLSRRIEEFRRRQNGDTDGGERKDV